MADRTGSISTYKCREHHTFEWRIHDFSTLDETDDSCYYSPDFSFGGEKWRLWIYPDGVSYRGTSGHVDLGLFKLSSGRSITQSFSLSLKTAKGEKYREEHYTKDFQNYYLENCHELLRFISRAELTTLSSELLPDDVLTVVCTMKKGTTSAGSESNSASAEISTPVPDSAGCSSDSGECRHCNENFAAGILSSHQRKCEQRPVKCPDCLEVVVLQKFLNEHECHHNRPEAENSESNCVETSTQTEEENGEESENICVEASTQTGEENAENSKNTLKESSTQTEEINADEWFKDKSKTACVDESTQTEEQNEGEETNADVNKLDVVEASGSSQAASPTTKESKREVSNAEVNKSDVAEASGSSQVGTTTTKESEGDASKAEKIKSDVAEASGSNQAGTTTIKEAVLKWIEENCEVASKGKKRKTEAENILKWIEQNYDTPSDAKKRKMEEKNDEVYPSGSSTNSHLKKLHDDLKELFLKKEDCDIIIKVKGSEIPAHRVILKARSPVFASTFQHNMKEKATGVVEIEDCDPSPFMDFLRYIYYGDVGMISHENVFDLFRLADKYEILDLRVTCLEFIKQNITVNTFCETITLALQHTENELIVSATDFFVRNAEEILQTVKWQTFSAENPTQSNELVIKLVKWFKHSNL